MEVKIVETNRGRFAYYRTVATAPWSPISVSAAREMIESGQATEYKNQYEQLLRKG